MAGTWKLNPNLPNHNCVISYMYFYVLFCTPSDGDVWSETNIQSDGNDTTWFVWYFIWFKSWWVYIIINNLAEHFPRNLWKAFQNKSMEDFLYGIPERFSKGIVLRITEDNFNFKSVCEFTISILMSINFLSNLWWNFQNKLWRNVWSNQWKIFYKTPWEIFWKKKSRKDILEESLEDFLMGYL